MVEFICRVAGRLPEYAGKSGEPVRHPGAHAVVQLAKTSVDRFGA